MTTPMAGKVALITGAAGGIGRASALAFAACGAQVVVADIDADGNQDTLAQIESGGGSGMSIRVDVTQAGEVEELVRRTVNTFGRLDYAHNNAGIAYAPGEFGSVAEQTERVWDAIMNVNLKGIWLCMRAELPHMVTQGGGAIVNTASVLGLVGSKGLSAYVASKHGVVGLTKTAALEYARYNIRVNAVCPGVIDTAMVEPIAEIPGMQEAWIRSQAIRRLGRADEVAAAAVWLCSDAASFVTGHMMAVDGGQLAQ